MGNTLQKLPQIPSPSHQTQTQNQQSQSQIELHHNNQHEQEFTCEICIEPISVSTNPQKKFKNGEKCSHPYCTDCMIKYIRVKLDDDNVGRIQCPALNCTHALDPIACASLVGAPLFLRWCDVLCEAAIEGRDKCYCPYQNCNVLIVNECGGNPKKSKCPSCKRFFCFKCKRVWHAGFECEESGELRDGNDVAFGRLAELKRWNRCPRCRHFVELREGCQIVKCRCGISFCYKCGTQVHQHWCRCDKTSMCCVWCFRICIVLIVVSFTFFFFMWVADKHGKNSKHH